MLSKKSVGGDETAVITSVSAGSVCPGDAGVTRDVSEQCRKQSGYFVSGGPCVGPGQPGNMIGPLRQASG
jgi:hypothetical protein